MAESVEYDILEDGLKRCGATWDAAQAHGLLAGRLAIAGLAARQDWLLQVLDGADDSNALRVECQKLLDTLYQATFWQLSERQSGFEPLLPDDSDDIGVRVTGLAHWCEGFLHGLVSANHADALKQRLGAEPLADIIKDMVHISQAGLDVDCGDDDNESNLVELVEYVRVAAQLCYEELANLRSEGMTANER